MCETMFNHERNLCILKATWVVPRLDLERKTLHADESKRRGHGCGAGEKWGEKVKVLGFTFVQLKSVGMYELVALTDSSSIILFEIWLQDHVDSSAFTLDNIDFRQTNRSGIWVLAVFVNNRQYNLGHVLVKEHPDAELSFYPCCYHELRALPLCYMPMLHMTSSDLT